ncbi:hypothetical protein [Streptococcus thoraltensis]|uniref:hypothetical protein n=1 Tax=Streptococcus thoraltensis TaxID=55085 RepID=UPI001F59B4C4|nr:hypothetical protein [Streptococcus thoraltensis]
MRGLLDTSLWRGYPDVGNDENVYVINPHYTDHSDWIEGSLTIANGLLTVR